jgi:hypothetical protein
VRTVSSTRERESVFADVERVLSERIETFVARYWSARPACPLSLLLNLLPGAPIFIAGHLSGFAPGCSG